MSTDFPPVSAPDAGVIWITGYSAAGKTTVCRKVHAALKRRGVHAVFLDGDDLRAMFGAKWGYSHADRTELAQVYLRLASHLAAQGMTVVFSAVAMYAEVYDWFRRHVPRSFLVYLDVPLGVRVERDRETKHVYSQIMSADARYDEPSDPDIVVRNHGATTADEAAADILAAYLAAPARRVADRGRSGYWNENYRANVGATEPSAFGRFAAGVVRPGRLLEVGCGNGRDAAHFSALGFEVTAIDTAQSAVELCERLHAGKGIRFLRSSVAGLEASQPGARYDAIYSRFVLHAMTAAEEREFIAGATRLLADGGTLLVECRSINDPLARLGERISPTERIHGHYRRFIVLDDLLESLAAAGFAPRQVYERKGLAPYGDEDPVVIRMVCGRSRA
jgi:adenylylsulfate kinase-like enzyme/SAM-dependent methyltransferase